MALRKTAVAGMSGMAVAYGVQQKRRTEAAASSGELQWGLQKIVHFRQNLSKKDFSRLLY